MDILQKLKSIYDSSVNKKIKNNFFLTLPYWVGAFITGLVAVVYAKLFSWAESFSIYLFTRLDWSFLIITPLCFLLAWWLVARFAPYSKGSGIPQVSAAIELSDPIHHQRVGMLLGFRIILVKVLSSLVMILGGGITGREGPTIQISASIFKKVNDILPSWYPAISKHNMIITGAASGLASAFNTPLGGIVFAIEELTKTHFNFMKSELLTGVIIAGLTSLYLLGPYLYLGYPQTNNVSYFILFTVIPVSLIAGSAGSGMGLVILLILKKKEALKLNYQKVGYVLLCGMAIAVLGVFVDQRIFGSGKEIMATLLFTNDKYLQWYVPLLKIGGSILSFSTGASGGVFAPSLSVGACIGAVISGWLHLSGTETNLVILCGMVGFLTGVTRSPFTSSILVIEMTSDHGIIFFLMLTALLANLISRLVSKHSFYEYLKFQYVHELDKK